MNTQQFFSKLGKNSGYSIIEIKNKSIIRRIRKNLKYLKYYSQTIVYFFFKPEKLKC